MIAHSLLKQTHTKSKVLGISGNTYRLVLSYNRVIGIDGYVVGLKFTVETINKDAAKAGSVHGMRLANAVGRRVVQMIKPDLATVSILGFYLLAADLDACSQVGRRAKMRLYHTHAVRIKKELISKLQHLTATDLVDSAAWILSDKPHYTYDQFTRLDKELAKQLQGAVC